MPTNLDRIREMNAKEFSDWRLKHRGLCSACAYRDTYWCKMKSGHTCEDGLIAWLNEEAE